MTGVVPVIHVFSYAKDAKLDARAEHASASQHHPAYDAPRAQIIERG